MPAVTPINSNLASKTSHNGSDKHGFDSGLTGMDLMDVVRDHVTHKRIKEAYEYIKSSNISFFDNFNDLEWLKLARSVFDSYKEKYAAEINDLFYEKYFDCLRTVTICHLQAKNFAEIEEILFQFDQDLHKAYGHKCNKNLWSQYLKFVANDFLTLCADLLLLKLKKGKIAEWRKVCRLTAYCYAVQLKNLDRPGAVWWRRLATFNLIQAGQMLNSMKAYFEEENHWSKISESLNSSQLVKDLWNCLFSIKVVSQHENSSFLLTHLKPMNNNDLEFLFLPFDVETDLYNEILCANDGSTLNFVVWLLLHYWNAEKHYITKDDGVENLDKSLNFKPADLETINVNNLCQLDLKVFLHLSVHCAASRNERIGSKLKRFSFNITDFITTEWQKKFWRSCLQLIKEGGNNEIRTIVNDGLNFLRLKSRNVPNLRLIFSTAFALEVQAKLKKDEGDSNCFMAISDYAKIYWTFLDKNLTEGKHPISKPDTPFYVNLPPLSKTEKDNMLELSKFYIAANLNLHGKHEDALELLKKLIIPQAFYAQAEIYKKLADSIECKGAGDEQALAKKRAFNSKARQIYQAARNASTFGETSFASEMADLDYSNTSPSSVATDGASSAATIRNLDSPLTPGGPDAYCTPRANNTNMQLMMTPGIVRSNSRSNPSNSGTAAVPMASFFTELGQSLDFTLRSLSQSHEMMVKSVLEQNKALTDTVKTMTDQLRQLSLTNKELSKTNQDLAEQMHEIRKESTSLVTEQVLRTVTENLIQQQHQQAQQQLQRQQQQFQLQQQTQQYINQQQQQQNYGAQFFGASGILPNVGFAAPVVVPQSLMGRVGVGAPLAPDMTSFPTVSAPMAPAVAPQIPSTVAMTFSGSAVPVPATIPAVSQPTMSASFTFTGTPQAPPARPLTPMTSVLPQSQAAPISKPLVPAYPAATPIPAASPFAKPAVSMATTTAAPPAATSAPSKATTAPPMPAASAPAGSSVFGKPASIGPQATTAPPAPVSTATTTTPGGPGTGVFKNFVFGGNLVSSTPTFAQLKEQTDVLSAEKPAFTGFAGAGRPVFASAASKSQVSTTPKATADSPNTKSPGERNRKESEDEQPFEPTAEFKPLVPLPALVEVKTGEEDEEVLFKERAKLFRYNAETNEFKERGLGDFKILRNPQGRVRILMRREQIHKLCANHTLTGDMRLMPMARSDRAFTWQCQDFSDNELKPETLAARFKTLEQAQQFKKVFEKCVEEISAGADQPPKTAEKSTEKPPETTKNEQKSENLGEKPVLTGFGDAFKPKPGSWTCNVCTVNNESDLTVCPCCNSDKDGNPAGSASEKPVSTGFGDAFKPKPGSWMCSVCAVNNGPDLTVCPCCNSGKDGNPAGSASRDSLGTGFSATSGSTTKPSFSFSTPTAATPGSKPGATFGGFTGFGSLPKSTPKFGFGLNQSQSNPLFTPSSNQNSDGNVSGTAGSASGTFGADSGNGPVGATKPTFNFGLNPGQSIFGNSAIFAKPPKPTSSSTTDVASSGGAGSQGHVTTTNQNDVIIESQVNNTDCPGCLGCKKSDEELDEIFAQLGKAAENGPQLPLYFDDEFSENENNYDYNEYGAGDFSY